MTDVFFWKPYPNSYSKDSWRRVFSQWHLEDFNFSTNVVYDMGPILGDNLELLVNKTFNCREQFMMACKALLFANANGDNKINNIEVFNKIMSTNNPKAMKSLGRKVKGFNDDTWNMWRYQIVVNGNYLQFSQNNELKNILLETDNKQLIEASPYDRVWGIGYTEDKSHNNKNNWGLNLLGLALMEVRDKLR